MKPPVRVSISVSASASASASAVGMLKNHFHLVQGSNLVKEAGGQVVPLLLAEHPVHCQLLPHKCNPHHQHHGDSQDRRTDPVSFFSYRSCSLFTFSSCLAIVILISINHHHYNGHNGQDRALVSSPACRGEAPQGKDLCSMHKLLASQCTRHTWF